MIQPAALILIHAWFGADCCSQRDCVEVEETAIHETAAGYTIRATGEFIPRGDRRIRESPPEAGGAWGWCRKIDGGAPNGHNPHIRPARPWQVGDTICLYVPGRGV